MIFPFGRFAILIKPIRRRYFEPALVVPLPPTERTQAYLKYLKYSSFRLRLASPETTQPKTVSPNENRDTLFAIFASLWMSDAAAACCIQDQPAGALQIKDSTTHTHTHACPPRLPRPGTVSIEARDAV